MVPAAEADHFVKDKAAAAPLLKPFTPDHIVYCGPYPLFVENIDQSKAALDAFMAENDKEPRLILVQRKVILSFFIIPILSRFP